MRVAAQKDDCGNAMVDTVPGVYLFEREIVAAKGALEVEITKGDGQYKTTVGFLDAVLTVRERAIAVTVSAPSREAAAFFGKWEATVAPEPMMLRRIRIAVEVKIVRPNLADLMRQIALYRGRFAADAWIVAGPWGLTPGDRKLLREADIHHIELGPKFAAWAEARRQETVQPTKQY